MRNVELREDDCAIFGATVNRTLYMMYRQNLKEFQVMLSDQGVGYWIRFCTTLKAVLEKEGYSLKYIASDVNYFQDFFVNLIDKLTSYRPAEGVQTLVNNVVSVARFSQLFSMLEMYEAIDEARIRCKTLVSLFGNDYECPYIQLWMTLPMYLRAVGSLLKIFELWLAAEPTEKIVWKIPENWNVTDVDMPCRFERYLKQKWGDRLIQLLDVDKEEIMWWDDDVDDNFFDEYDDGELVLIKSKGSELGDAINNIVISGMEKLQDFVTSGSSDWGMSAFASEMEKFQRYHMCLSYPRGAEVLLFFTEVEEMYRFYAACSRELYLTSSCEVFHPYSQFFFAFWNMSFNSKYWKTFDEIINDDTSQETKNVFLRRKSIKQKNSEAWKSMYAMFASHEVRTAIYLDSRFHDSVASETTWESPEAVVRLYWNMPLCLNWLETLLLRLYTFEQHFLPFVHYPVREQVKHLVEDVYVNQCKLTRFLVKSAIIVAEYITLNEDEHAGRCYDARCMLKYVISLLVPKMKFFGGPCYQILEVIINESYTEKEIRPVYKSEYARDRVFPNLESASCIPDVDVLFGSDRRSINYYFKVQEDMFGLQESVKHYPKVLQLLQKYEAHVKGHDCGESKCSENSNPFYSYDYTTHHSVADVICRQLCPKVNQHPTKFINYVFDLLEQDWLLEKKKKLKKKFAEFIAKEELPENDGDDKTMFIFELTCLSQVYTVCAMLWGDTHPELQETKPDQTLLSRLINAECRASMADVSSRFLVTAFRQFYPRIKPQPTFKVFDQAKETICSLGLKHLNLSEANQLLSSLEESYSVDLTTTTLLQVVPCPFNASSDADSLTSESLEVFLGELSEWRYRLLHEISEQQFSKTRVSSETGESRHEDVFPHLNILEFRYVEEMASLKKCLELGEKQKVTSERLSSLLYHRAEWLFQEFKKWRDSKTYSVCRGIPFNAPLHETAASLWIQITAVLIQLQSIFNAYLSTFNTVHPVSQGTLDILTQWQMMFLKLMRKPDTETNFLKTMGQYYEALKVMGLDYLTELLDHCTKTWNIPELYVDLKCKVATCSREHAEKIYSALLHFFFFFCHSALAKPNDSFFDCMSILTEIVTEFIKAGVLLRAAAVDPSVNWNKTCCRLQLIYLAIFSGINFGINVIDYSWSDPPLWKGYRDEYRDMFMSALENDDSSVIEFLDMEEFITRDMETESENVKEEVKENAKKQEAKNEEQKVHHAQKCNQRVSKTTEISEKDGKLVIEEKIIKTTEHSADCTCLQQSNDSADDLSELSKEELKRLKKKAKKARYKSRKKDEKAKRNDEASNRSGGTVSEGCASQEGVNKKKENGERRNCDKNKTDSLSEKNMRGDHKENMQSVRVQKLKKCFICNKTEKVQCPFLQCAMCVKSKWTVPRSYCSTGCLNKDMTEHLQDHKRHASLHDQAE